MLIDFTIAGTSFQAEQGMTWEQWVASSYNSGDYMSSGDNVMYLAGSSPSNVALPNGTDVLLTDIIIAETAYIRRNTDN